MDFVVPTVFTLLKEESVPEVRVSLMDNLQILAKALGE